MENDRLLNRTGDQTCVHCGDSAQVLVLLRRPEPAAVIGGPEKGKTREPAADSFYEEMGPCPHCESGFWLEFGIGRKWDEKKNAYVEYTNPSPPWGKQGYWRGRQPVYEAGT